MLDTEVQAISLEQKGEELTQKGQRGNNGGDEDLAKEFDEMKKMMDSM